MTPRRDIVRRVNAERALIAGGQRSLVMQLAHPMVAAAVAEHSDFPQRALSRLRRTLDLTLALVHGSQEEAQAAAERIRAVHRRVTGVVDGRAYRAETPELLLWVHATVVDTSLLVYGEFVAPLAPEEQRAYYESMKEPARLLGVPDAILPPDLDEFRAYLRQMLEGPELRGTRAGGLLVDAVLRPPVPLPMRPATEVGRLVTLALLPRRVRELFGLHAGPAARFALSITAGASRLTLPFLPESVRMFAQARGRPSGAAGQGPAVAS